MRRGERDRRLYRSRERDGERERLRDLEYERERERRLLRLLLTKSSWASAVFGGRTLTGATLCYQVKKKKRNCFKKSYKINTHLLSFKTFVL